MKSTLLDLGFYGARFGFNFTQFTPALNEVWNLKHTNLLLYEYVFMRHKICTTTQFSFEIIKLKASQFQYLCKYFGWHSIYSDIQFLSLGISGDHNRLVQLLSYHVTVSSTTQCVAVRKGNSSSYHIWKKYTVGKSWKVLKAIFMLRIRSKCQRNPEPPEWFEVNHRYCTHIVCALLQTSNRI